jgi:hypothetical protein
VKDVLQNKLQEINNYLSSNAWYDFMVHKIDSNNNLHIIGSTDLCYYYGIEVVFHNIFYMNCNFHWNTDPQKDVFVLPTEEEKNRLIYNYQIPKGYDILVKIVSEDTEPFYIASNDISVKYGEFGYLLKD